jgi:hypothetical protein
MINMTISEDRINIIETEEIVNIHITEEIIRIYDIGGNFQGHILGWILDEEAVGDVDSTNKDFTTVLPYAENSLHITWNGIWQEPGVDFIEVDNTTGEFSVVEAPISDSQQTDSLRCSYKEI